MRLYHYAPLQNNIPQQGINTFKNGYGDVKPYTERAGSENRQKIISWMEGCFPGRSRAISVVTEPIKWEGNDLMLKEFIEIHRIFSFELNDLIQNEIIESIWCQEGDKIYSVQPEEIDFSPLLWEKCNQEKGIFFGVIRHYFIVLKEGVLSPKYIREEERESAFSNVP